jgi:hypothetical protein
LTVDTPDPITITNEDLQSDDTPKMNSQDKAFNNEIKLTENGDSMHHSEMDLSNDLDKEENDDSLNRSSNHKSVTQG